MNRLFAALRFLTVLPLPGTRGTASEDLARSVPFFPVIGVALGIAAAAVAFVTGREAPSMVTAAITVIAVAAFSGCLHLDGLSDTADGFLSARPRERILEIMKDSRVGVMGVVALIFVLLLKFAALASLSRGAMWRTALLMPIAGRAAIVFQMTLLPYVRPEGLGSVFQVRRLHALWAAAVLLIVGFGALGPMGVIAAGAALIATWVFALYCRRKIGGATGDTYGASCEIAEMVAAVAISL
jgi:adenosylcobinamide-GDP ribazoletransferase